MRKEAHDYQNMDTDPVIEPWRAALDEETLLYTANHYRHGVSFYHLLNFDFVLIQSRAC